MMNIVQEHLTDELKKKIYAGFKEHAIESAGQDGMGDPIAFVSKENNEYVGAVVVQPFWGTLHIKYVWVRGDKRNQQIGKSLLEAAFEYGQAQNYPFAFVETMSFQALGFYQKMGFALEFTRHGYADGLAFHYLRKDFAQSFEFKRLSEVSKESIIELMNHPLILRHMPLATGKFNEDEYHQFIKAKQAIWNERGYGPWAFVVNGQFVGWGGLQPENDDVEIALVLHPKYWGLGKATYDKIIDYAFGQLGLNSLIVLFPPSRSRIKGLFRLGFEKDGEVEIQGQKFFRYRLFSQKYQKGKSYE